MRLIGDFKDERQAFDFQTFLERQGIHSSYDSFRDPQGMLGFHFWVLEEDDYDKVIAWYTQFLANPSDKEFYRETPLPAAIAKEKPRWKIRVEMPRNPPRFTLTNFFILMCGLIFIWNNFEKIQLADNIGLGAVELGATTQIEQTFFFDDPGYFKVVNEFFTLYPVKTVEDLQKLPPEAQTCFKKVEAYPTWKGFFDIVAARNLGEWKALPKGSLFHNIREGEVWRLVTPIFLHGSLLHILFNMAWLWVLGRQIEERIGAWRLCLMVIILAAIPNIAQYLMSGPAFLGFSGVVVGMAGFVWMREKIAPWEGYPLQRVIIVFLFVYVIAMVALELISFFLQYFHLVQLALPIANTAHVVGGIIGIALARLHVFARSKRA